MDENSLEGDSWVDVFKQRGVWQLTPEIVRRWMKNNAAFFRILSELVPVNGRILELGCGPGRHAIAAALLNYRVSGVDINRAVVEQARKNAELVAPEAEVSFLVGDISDLQSFCRHGGYQAVTHGGLMEHFPSAESIRSSLTAQLDIAPYIVFDVPINTPKNLRLFEKDDIFRQMWTVEEWLYDVLGNFNLVQWQEERHSEPAMTDDLVVALGSFNDGQNE
ncbi:MAG: class I SAM-dependent methyltransferase [Egibacteraceae bacterium]